MYGKPHRYLLSSSDELELVTAPSTSTIGEVALRLESSGFGFCILIDSSKKFIGLVSDGDLRRSLLRNVSTSEPAASQLPEGGQFTKLESEIHPQELDGYLRKWKHLPVLGEDGKLLGVWTSSLTQLPSTSMLLMAGGLGERMRPLTLETPKPLIEINGKSLIQRAIEHARSYGIEDFFVSTKHMSEKIEDALGDGSDLGVKVTYLKETQPLGTAGCLSLLAGKLTSRNLIVQNSDILTTLNISDLVQELQSPQVSAVVCGKEFLWQNPFGVLDHDGGFLTTIREKPTTSFLVSAGVYGFRASMLEVIDFPSGRFDMPEMLTQIKGLGGNVRVYEVEDYWRDVGTIESLRLAEKELARD